MLAASLEQLRRRWADLGLIGVANLLAQILTYLVIVGVITPSLLGYGGRRMALPRLSLTTGMGPREILALAAGAAGGASLLVLAVTLCGAAFMLAGLFGAVASLRRGDRVGFRTFWNAGARGVGRALGVVVLFVVGAFVLLFLMGAFLWFLLPWNLLVWALVAIPGTLYFLLYPVYLAAVDGLPVGEAFRKAWVGLVRDPGEAVLAGLTVLGLAIAWSLVVGVLVRLGILGQILGAFLQLLAVPTFVLYVIERFEAQVRPRVRAAR